MFGSSNEGSIGAVNDANAQPTETSIHIEIIPAGQSSPSLPNEDQPINNKAVNLNTDGVYTLETLSSSSSVQIKDN